jgi:tetratricopeptide (TPR) repeat protein
VTPQSAEALSDLGTQLLAAGQTGEAIDALRAAAQLRPDSEVIHFNLANSLTAAGQVREAIHAYRLAIQLRPTFVEAHCNLAAALQEEGNYREALLHCREALQQAPHHAVAYTILGNVFKSLEQIESAIDAYRQSLSLNPTLVEALTGLAASLQVIGNFDEAAACCRRALEIQPNFAPAYNNLGTCLEQSGYLHEALGCFCRAIELSPNYGEPHLNRAALLLLAGDYERGWVEYEWRWKSTQARPRDLRPPHWQGEPLAGRTILLHAEQGLGDTIQFVRYASLVKQLGATVIVECQPPLQALLATCPGIDRLIARGDSLPPFDFHTPLLSLPRLLKTSLSTIPAPVPYLASDQRLVDLWRDKMQGLPSFRVGVNWRGRASRGLNQRRDIPIAALAALADAPGVQLISLQKGAPAEDLARLPGLSTFDSQSDFDAAHGAFMDTAAVMTNLDLVISSDTAIAHLAGALGVPVWLLLPALPDWRWLLGRDDSPWYPTMRLFRQQTAGDWQHVVRRVRDELRSLIPVIKKN